MIGTLPLCLFYSGSNNSCVLVVDRWLDNAGEQCTLSLLSRILNKLRGMMSNGDLRAEKSETEDSYVADESRARIEMEMRNEREKEVVA